MKRPQDVNVTERVPPALIRAATVCTCLLAGYFLLILSDAGSLDLRMRYVLLLFVISCVMCAYLIRNMVRRGTLNTAGLAKLSLAVTMTLISLLVADNCFTLYENTFQASRNRQSSSERLKDGNIWSPELYSPLVYFPTINYFRLHKPNTEIAGPSYGDMYYPELLESPTLAKAVLSPREISYQFDEHGLRENSSIGEARIFAVGDSFAFGVGVQQEARWTELLEESTGEQIYNLSPGPSAPNHQRMVLEYLLRTQEPEIKIERLLWMVFEGNDLEDKYTAKAPVDRDANFSFEEASRGTLIEPILLVPFRIRKNSLINRFANGRLTRPRTAHPGPDSPYVVDDQVIDFPLYHSEKHGYRLFYPDYVARATKSEQYVLQHPNRVRFDQAMKAMKALADRHGFSVTVLVAPQAARLYAREFGIPGVTSEPHFVNHVIKQASLNGFDSVGLHEKMAPYASEELLYFRDDTHWNVRGNEVVADIVAEACFADGN